MESGHNASDGMVTSAPEESRCRAHGSCSKGSCRGIRSGTYILGSVLCCTLAMFIWMKLRVVTNVPRTAYADPESRQADGNAAQPAAPGAPVTPAGAAISDGTSGSPIFERP